MICKKEPYGPFLRIVAIRTNNKIDIHVVTGLRVFIICFYLMERTHACDIFFDACEFSRKIYRL